MKCRQCGHINEEGARFCEKCGQPLIEESRPLKPKKKHHFKWLIPFLLILIVAVGGGIALVMTRSPQSKDYTMLLDEADRYLVGMEYAQAEASYLEAIQIDKKQTMPYERLTELYLTQEDYPKAQEILQRALSNVEDESTFNETYTYVRYMNEEILADNGQVHQGEYDASYAYQNEIPTTAYVEDVKGLMTSDIRDYDKDGQTELLAVSLDESGSTLTLVLTMYEYQEDSVVLSDQQRLGTVLGGDDAEQVGLYLKDVNGTPYIYGFIEKKMDFASQGTQANHFVFTYDGSQFVSYLEMSTTEPFIADENAVASFEQAAALLENIGLYASASQTYDTAGQTFGIVQADGADETLLTIQGKRANQDVGYTTGISLEACGKVQYRLVVYMETPEKTAETLYQPVLDAYHHALSSQEASINPLILNEQTTGLLAGEKPEDLFYHLLDIDENGVEELFIAKSDGTIVDVWTYDGVDLRSLELQGQLLSDKSIRCQTAENRYTFYTLADDGYEICTKRELKAEDGSYYSRENSSQWMSIGQTDYESQLSDEQCLSVQWTSIVNDYVAKTQAPTYNKADILNELEALETQTEEMTSSAMSTIEMISTSKEATELWEAEMNQIITLLKQSMNETQSAAFDHEQAEWEIEKEEIASEASSEYEGGSLSGVALSSARLEETRKRTYELYNRLQ